MGILIAVLAFVALGFGAVAWLYIKDRDSIASSIEKLDPEQIRGVMINESEDTSFSDNAVPFNDSPAEKKGFLKGFSFKGKKDKTDLPFSDPLDQEEKSSSSLIAKLFKKFKFGKKDDFDDDIPKATPFPDLKPAKSGFGESKEFTPQEKLKQTIAQQKNNPLNQTPASSPVKKIETPSSPVNNESAAEPEFSPGEPLSEIEQKQLDMEIDNSIEETSLKEKYNQLDKLFTEKSAELQRLSTALENEQKNRKDFNKLKDILEKEIKDLKDQNKKADLDYQSSREENGNYKQRVNQLEDKITQLEKELISKEQEIEEFRNAPSPENTAEKNPDNSTVEEPVVPSNLPKVDLNPDNSDKRNEAHKQDLEEITPTEPPSLPALEIVDQSKTQDISTTPSENIADEDKSPLETPSEKTILFEEDAHSASAGDEKPEKKSIADEIEASIKMEDSTAKISTEPPAETPAPAEENEDIQLGLTADETSSVPEDNTSQEEKMSELEKQIKAMEIENTDEQKDSDNEKREET